MLGGLDQNFRTPVVSIKRYPRLPDHLRGPDHKLWYEGHAITQERLDRVREALEPVEIIKTWLLGRQDGGVRPKIDRVRATPANPRR